MSSNNGAGSAQQQCSRIDQVGTPAESPPIARPRYRIPPGRLLAVLVGVVLLASVGGVCWLMNRHVSLDGYHHVSGLPSNIEMRLNHVRFRGVSGGKIVWEVEADHFDVAQNQLTFRATGLKRIAMLKAGKEELTVSADVLDRNIITGDIALSGNVIVLGKDLRLSMSNVVWNDRMQLFSIPGQINVQFGDLTLSSDAGTVYNVGAATVRADGQITLAMQGNTFTSRGATINLATQSFTIDGPAHASVLVDDLQQWGNGENLPRIPDIPAPIQERYQAFRQSHK